MGFRYSPANEDKKSVLILYDHHVDFSDVKTRQLIVALVAQLTVRCALQRRESRGIHFNLNCPEPGPEARDSIL